MSNPFSKLRIRNIIYDVKDAVARANIGNLSDLITVSKDTLVDAINEAASSGGTAGITWVSNNATSSEIEAAYQSGNIVGVKSGGMIYYLTNRGGPTLHRFTSKYSNTLYGLTCNNNEWYNETRYVPGASIVPARPIGQASEGSSGSFARGDHVHDFSAEYKNALLNCFRNVAWIDDDGLTYFNALKRAIGIGILNSITAVFTQGQTVVYPDTSLDSLKSMLTVTANYSDSTSETLEDSDYTLSGTLSAGTSIVTVTYEDKTTTFNVSVTARPALASISAVFTQGQTIVYDTDSLDSLKSMLVVTATYSDSSTSIIPDTDYTLSGTLTVGTSTITVSYEGETDTFTVIVSQESPYTFYDYIQGDGYAYINTGLLASTYCTNDYEQEIKVAGHNAESSRTVCGARQQWGSANSRLTWHTGATYAQVYCGKDTGYVMSGSGLDVPVIIKTTRDKGIYCDGTLVDTGTATVAITHTGMITLFAECTSGQGSGYVSISGTNAYAGAFSKCRIYYFKVRDNNDDLIADIRPALRKSDNAIGMYDMIRDIFFENARDTGTFSLGNE